MYMQHCLRKLPLLAALWLGLAPSWTAGNLLELKIREQEPFLRQQRGWTGIASEGFFASTKWAYGAWDKDALIELTLGTDETGRKYLSLANLEGKPSLMLFRKAIAEVEAGQRVTLSFTYRTQGAGNVRLTVRPREGDRKTYTKSLDTTDEWQKVAFTIRPEVSGTLGVDIRATSRGRDKALDICEAKLDISEFIMPDLPLIQPPHRRADVSDVTGAVIDESDIAAVLHVDVEAPADGDGTSTAPFRTFAAAWEQAKTLLTQRKPVKILLAPGVYREGGFEIRFPDNKKARETTLIIEGATPGAVIFSGADLFTSWTDEGNGIWSAPWPHDFGFHAGLMGRNNIMKLLGQRREMVFINDQWQHPVILEDHDYSLKKLDRARKKEGQHGGGRTHSAVGHWTYRGLKQPTDRLFTGSFGVAEKDENGNKLYIRPPDGVHPNTASIVVTTRKQWGRIAYKDNLILRNLVFERYASPVFPEEWWQRSNAVQFGHPGRPGFFQNQNVLVENCVVRWNSGSGITFGKIRNLTVTNVEMHHNGTCGASTGDCHNILWQNVATNFNNWRGLLGGKQGWAIAGVKFHQFRDAIIRNPTSLGNATRGMWWDVNCENFVVESPMVVGNTQGLFLEIGKGPQEIVGGLIADNGTGLKLLCAEHVTVKDTVIWEGDANDPDDGSAADEAAGTQWQNVQSGIFYHHYWRGSHKSDAQWDQLGHHLDGRPKTHNEFYLPGPALANVVAVGSGKRAFFSNIWLNPDQRDPRVYKRAWVGRDNLYHAENNSPFLFRNFDAPEGSPERLTEMGLDQHASRFVEINGHIADPGFADPESYDFTVAPDSPLAGRNNLPLVKLPPEQVLAIRAFKQWLESLKPGKGWNETPE